MSITLSYGYKKPQTGDRGAALFSDLEFDIQRLNDHSHNGTDSSFLTAQAILGVNQNILAAGWAAYGGPIGFFRQMITVPPGFSFDTVQISLRTSAGEYAHNKIEKISATQYYVYSTDSTLNLLAVYGG